MTFQYIILACWVVWLVVWVISAFNVKKDARERGIRSALSRYWLSRIVILILAIFVILRLTTGTTHRSGRLFTNILFIFSVPLFLGWLGAFFAMSGAVIAIWARFHLGKNWSSFPTKKENHELVTSGPYTYVRHPIYSGVILLAFGMAIAGSVVGIGALIIWCFIFIPRIRKEEKIMLELFPDKYPEYQKHTKRLIPFVW